MRAAKGRAKAWLVEVTSRERRRSRRPQQKQRKPPRPKAAPCCIYPLPKDIREVTKAAAAAIAGQMSQRQASKEHTVSRFFFKPCQHLCGFMWVQFYTQWYVQGVFVAYSGFLWLPMGPSGSPVA